MSDNRCVSCLEVTPADEITDDMCINCINYEKLLVHKLLTNNRDINFDSKDDLFIIPKIDIPEDFQYSDMIKEGERDNGL